MIKNIQLKIILIFTIITVILITGFSVYFLNNLQNIRTQASAIENAEQLVNSTKQVIDKGIIFTIFAIVAFCIIATVIAIFITKKVTNPINKLISSAKRIAAGEEVEIKQITKKEDKEVSELVGAFGLMTT